MDPDANLSEQRRAISRIHSIKNQKEGPTMGQLRDLQYEAYRLADLCDSMDTWLRQGGFRPAFWQPAAIPAVAVPAVAP